MSTASWTAASALPPGSCSRRSRADRSKGEVIPPVCMSRQPLFAGLVIDEADHVVGTAFVGDEPCYVVDDNGFLRHIPAEQVDRAVLSEIAGLMKGSEDLLSEQTAKMLGQDDVFTKAAIEQQLRNI